MAQRHDLIALLADGKFHSGEELGEALSLTRSAIWKVTQQLTELGINLHRVKGKGYQIPNGIELLNPNVIGSHFQKCKLQVNLLTALEIDSTNQYLLDARTKLPSGTVILAEYQAKGRGRRQRTWSSPYGANLYCSFLWQFNKDPSELFGLSLASGVAIVNALERYGLHQIKLKWPNDVLWQNKKLGGTLIELAAEPHSQTDVIIGIGINLTMSEQAPIDQQWIDIARITRQPAKRNLLAAYLIEEMFEMLHAFQENGFASFFHAWQSLDAYPGAPVKITTPTNEFCGIAKGITSTGELVLEADGKEIKFLHGDVSLRPTSTPI